jgi:thioredoxin reductase
MTPTSRPPKDRYDVVVIGGGAAGLSAAVTLGRALRSVVVLDDGRPRNAPAEGVHGFLTREGMSPQALLGVGRAEARSFGATLLDTSAVTAARSSEGFTVGLADGGTVIGRRLLVATGLTDGLPPIPGLREQWGAGVVHCPYCHGYEIRGRRIGVLGTGPLSVHQALLFRQWSDDITLFLNDTVAPSDEDWDRLAARSVRVVDGCVVSVDAADGVLTGVTLLGGRHMDLQALAVGTRMEARSALLEPLGLVAREHPSGMGHALDGGPMGSTEVPGLYVAGNVANLAAQVVVAAAEGTMAGAAINADLVQEETAWAVEGVRGPFSAALEAEVSDRVLGVRRHGLADGLADGLAGGVHHGVHDGVAGDAAPDGTKARGGVRRAG